MKRKLKFIYTTIISTGIVLLLLEIALGVYFNYHDKSGIDSKTERIIATGLYEESLTDIEAKELLRELREQDMMWESYLHYRFKPFNGKHNTIYKNGLRKTVNQSLKDSTNALKIFCFGGSTMFSSGARDTHTIPSELSNLIAANYQNQNIEISNFGCHGYTRASENIQLQRELIKGNIPDIVIFYDGVNEVISAHQNNEAGTPTNAYNRKAEFKIAFNYKKRIRLMVTSSNLYRFVTTLQRKLFTKSAYKQLSSRSDTLALDISKNYIGLVKLSKSLENEYGFDVYNFMQPHIYSKKNLSPAEKEYHKGHIYYENLYRISYENVLKNNAMINDSTFIDISNVFDKTDKTIYFDFCHTGEYGNQLVANSIFKHIENSLKAKFKTTNIQTEPQLNSPQK